MPDRTQEVWYTQACLEPIEAGLHLSYRFTYCRRCSSELYAAAMTFDGRCMGCELADEESTP